MLGYGNNKIMSCSAILTKFKKTHAVTQNSLSSLGEHPLTNPATTCMCDKRRDKKVNILNIYLSDCYIKKLIRYLTQSFYYTPM